MSEFEQVIVAAIRDTMCNPGGPASTVAVASRLQARRYLVSGLSEANLQFQTISLLFLPNKVVLGGV